MTCKTKKSTRSNRRKNNDSSITTKEMLELPIKIGLLGVTVGLVGKMK